MYQFDWKTMQDALAISSNQFATLQKISTGFQKNICLHARSTEMSKWEGVTITFKYIHKASKSFYKSFLIFNISRAKSPFTNERATQYIDLSST